MVIDLNDPSFRSIRSGNSYRMNICGYVGLYKYFVSGAVLLLLTLEFSFHNGVIVVYAPFNLLLPVFIFILEICLLGHRCI